MTKFSSDDDDTKAFTEAMRGVKKLKQNKHIPETKAGAYFKKKHKQPSTALEFEQEETFFHFSDYEKHALVDSETALFFARPHIGKKILRKLHQGQYNIEAVLDLHGKTIAEANHALGAFLSLCQRNQLSHILIIHGKGNKLSKPVLKNKVNHWLQETNQVLAFCSARPKDGDKGALYVLLRR